MKAPRCPICRKPIADADPKWRPFCSERCKLLDLAKWLDAEYAIPGPPADADRSEPGDE